MNRSVLRGGLQASPCSALTFLLHYVWDTRRTIDLMPPNRGTCGHRCKAPGGSYGTALDTNSALGWVAPKRCNKRLAVAFEPDILVPPAPMDHE